MKWLAAALLAVVLMLQYRLWLSGDGVRELVAPVGRGRAPEGGERRARPRATSSSIAEVADLKAGMAAIEERARSELGMIGRNETFYQVVPVRPSRTAPRPRRTARRPPRADPLDAVISAPMRYFVVIPAAGSGRRFSASVPKQYAALGVRRSSSTHSRRSRPIRIAPVSSWRSRPTMRCGRPIAARRSRLIETADGRRAARALGAQCAARARRARARRRLDHGSRRRAALLLRRRPRRCSSANWLRIRSAGC